MALYADIISLLRQDVGDFPIRRFDSADGDGQTVVFQLNDPKVYENSLSVKIGGVLQVENTAYTVDYDVGQVVFNSGFIPVAGNDNVTFEYKSVNLRDADWIDIINQVLDNLRSKIWIEVIDSSNSALVTALDQVDYPLAGVADNILHILNIEYRTDNNPTNPAPWQDVKGKTNIVFYRDAQILHMRPPIQVTGYQMRMRFNRAYVKGSNPTSTFEPQSQYWHALRKYGEALYWERRAAMNSAQLGALSKEKMFENMQDLKKIAQTLRQEADQIFKRIRPKKPAVAIPQAVFGVNI